MFECLQRIAAMRKLAIEELDFRRGQLALLRLVKRAKKVCNALGIKD